MGVAPSRGEPITHSISWVRVPIPQHLNALLHATSDAQAWIQAGGTFGALMLTAFAAMYAWYALRSVALTVCLVPLYGMQANFCINAMHELGHAFVFRTKWLNSLFMRLFSFLGWLHPDMFFSSHLRHHRFTQNAPWDLENPAPIRLTMGGFVRFAVVDYGGFGNALKQTWRIAWGVSPSGHLGWLPEWEARIVKADDLGVARAWAWTLLVGHASIGFLSWWFGVWLPPLLFSLGAFYGGWLFFLCNTTQHVGLEQQTNDFRKNCRTFVLHPVVAFFYWHMNWHTEHHMYAAVPCYNLAALHEALKESLPKPANGIYEVWTQRIIPILKKQMVDANTHEEIALPSN